MSHSKQIVCLSNSRKMSGRCIAGREWSEEHGPGNWIRPVSARDGQEVSEYERQYEDGSDPKVLDIIHVPMIERKPSSWQPENWLLDPKFYWRKAGTYSRFDLSALVDPIEPLWADGYSTYEGENDNIPLDAMSRVSDSLRLIYIERLMLHVFSPGEAFGNSKRRVQAEFSHAGVNYALWVTDPIYEEEYLAKLDGSHEIHDCYLTISIGDPYEGACYKLVTAVIERDRR